MTKRYQIEATVEMMEALAIFEGLVLAKSMSIQNIIVEGDCEKVFKLLNMNVPNLAQITEDGIKHEKQEGIDSSRVIPPAPIRPFDADPSIFNLKVLIDMESSFEERRQRSLAIKQVLIAEAFLIPRPPELLEVVTLSQLTR
ncbi:uncharacterized protein G2W53_041093 [Senna tora]|uniref:RNase H type-1 domain-containing protein n=1 Tax=Senna tora TaxID=362788 RepID=A0A834VYG4_9FABA|nr:uncharacterized protein G2W53_041093 [Senna tora]